jgi:putative toxin-antitoxin system antitoxin component (TIGR02293 family)
MVIEIPPEIEQALIMEARSRGVAVDRLVQDVLATIALSSAESAAIQMGRLLPVVARAIAVFGDERKATHWLAAPLSILGDRSPAEVLQRRDGVERVEQILTRIEHNIPS